MAPAAQAVSSEAAWHQNSAITTTRAIEECAIVAENWVTTTMPQSIGHCAYISTTTTNATPVTWSTLKFVDVAWTSTYPLT
jgi:hypothetical protein